MVTKGGYRLIDFGGVDISTSKTISGIYNKIADTDKRIVGCNITLGTTKFKELTLDVKKDGTNLVLSNSIIKVTITNANAVVGLAFTDDNSSNKVIYWHGLDIYESDNNTLSLTACVLSTDNNALDSVDKVLEWARNIISSQDVSKVDLSVNGELYYGEKLWHIHLIRITETNVTFYGGYEGGTGYTSIAFTDVQFKALVGNVIDTINRIN